MAHKLILSEAGRIQREDGSTLDLTKLLGDAAAVLNTYTQTYSTALRTVANATTAAITDNTTGAVGTTLAAGVGVQTIPLYTNLVDITAADILSLYVPGYKFKILAMDFVVDKPATTGSKAATLTPKISTVAVTGGVVALTSALCTPAGALVSGSAVTAANTGSASASISLTGSSVTAFVEGNGWVLLKIQNMDTADAIASLADQITKAVADILAGKKVDNGLIDDLQSFLIVG